jgi:hypothetical protein
MNIDLKVRRFHTELMAMLGGCLSSGDVRFTPESGHVQCNSVCPLCANSGHVIFQACIPHIPFDLHQSR